MTPTICPRCSNTGYLGDRFCSCPFAATLRDRIETAPEFAEFRRKRAEIDRMLAALEAGQLEIEGIPPSYGRTRPVAVPDDAPAGVKERIRTYNALVNPTSNPEVN